jgi:hypothetical protein
MKTQLARLTVIAALVFMALQPAKATSIEVIQCGNKVIRVYGHHGFEFSELKPRERALPERRFRSTVDGWYFRGKKCHPAPPQSYCNDHETRQFFVDINGHEPAECSPPQMEKPK